MSETLSSQPQAFQHPEMVVYDSEQVGIRFSEVGDQIIWGRHKYADDPALGRDGIPNVIVRTESGNAYTAGAGILYMQRDRAYYDLRALGVQPGANITIGQRWNIPGVVETTRVQSVELRHKSGGHTDGMKQAGEDPFAMLDDIFARIESHRKR
jgi:hypothetical protein